MNIITNVLTHTHTHAHSHSGAWEYIESTRDVVRDLEKRVRLAKSNVEVMCSTMAKWCEAPLYQRKDDKRDSLLNLEVRASCPKA